MAVQEIWDPFIVVEHCTFVLTSEMLLHWGLVLL